MNYYKVFLEGHSVPASKLPGFAGNAVSGMSYVDGFETRYENGDDFFVVRFHDFDYEDGTELHETHVRLVCGDPIYQHATPISREG